MNPNESAVPRSSEVGGVTITEVPFFVPLIFTTRASRVELARPGRNGARTAEQSGRASAERHP
jgi:hypothetical protein